MANDTPTYDGYSVEVIDRESWRGTEVVQIQATDDGVTLSDKSGNAPWVEMDELE